MRLGRSAGASAARAGSLYFSRGQWGAPAGFEQAQNDECCLVFFNLESTPGKGPGREKEAMAISLAALGEDASPGREGRQGDGGEKRPQEMLQDCGELPWPARFVTSGTCGEVPPGACG